MTTTLTVQAERSEGWWVITSDQVRGLVSQARRLDQVEAQVRDALALLPESGLDPDEVEIKVDPVMSEMEAAHHARALAENARLAQSEASEAMRAAARRLANSGLTMRDVGTVLGISFQRAQKLASHQKQ